MNEDLKTIRDFIEWTEGYFILVGSVQEFRMNAKEALKRLESKCIRDFHHYKNRYIGYGAKRTYTECRCDCGLKEIKRGV